MKQVEVKSRRALRNWLKEHHHQAESIWLVTYKKAIPAFHVSYDEIVEEALCFGRIDSLPRKLDDQRTMIRLSPRKPKSSWSAINKSRVENLIKSKLMTRAGLAMVKLAKASGTWDKLNEVSTLKAPADLLSAFRKFAGSKKNFENFPPSVKRPSSNGYRRQKPTVPGPSAC